MSEPEQSSIDESALALPRPVTSLVGRLTEVAGESDLLKQSNVRLLTLTGPGGVGKTRLSLQIASTVGFEFRDDVAFIGLAAISDAALVLPRIAVVFGVRDTDAVTLVAILATALRDRQLFRVLVNIADAREMAF